MFRNSRRVVIMAVLVASGASVLSAGGAAEDSKARFKSARDGDYQAILEVLQEAKAALLAHLRIDMPGAKAIPQQRNFGRVY